MKEVLFDYVFKRAVAEVDALLNLKPGDPDLIYARAALLTARPKQSQPEITPRSGVEAPVVLDPVITDAAEILGKAAAERVVDRAEFSRYFVNPKEVKPGHWGTWSSGKATVISRRKDGAWEGFVRGHGMEIWDEEGTAEWDKNHNLVKFEGALENRA